MERGEAVKNYVILPVYERAKRWLNKHKLGLIVFMTFIPLITTGTFCYVVYRKLKSALNFDFNPEKQDLVMKFVFVFF